jgi:hypothetical protein
VPTAYGYSTLAFDTRCGKIHYSKDGAYCANKAKKTMKLFKSSINNGLVFKKKSKGIKLVCC